VFTGIIFGLSILITGFLAISLARNPVQRSIGFANVSRRKWSSALIVAGSMVGTALIAGSLVLSDSFDRFLQNVAFDHLGEVDVTVRNLDATTFEVLPMSPAMVDAISREALDDATAGQIDGVLGAIERGLPVAKVVPDAAVESGFRPVLAEPEVTVVGLDFTSLAGFGSTPSSLADHPTPDAGRAYVSESLARELELVVGDSIAVFYNNAPSVFEISKIVKDDGIAGLRIDQGDSTGTVLLSLSDARKLVELDEGEVDAVLISNVGGVIDGALATGAVTEAAQELLDAGWPEFVWFMRTDKADVLREDDGGGSIGDIFLMISSFAILAGVMLIINIYAMLAEERRTEMGIMRAVAFKRQQLVMTFAYEGFVYSVVASIIGTAVGMALGGMIVFGISEVFAQEDSSLFGGLPLTLNASTLLLAGAAGLLISFATAFITSFRISRLNIVMAIRDLPEPAGDGGSRWKLLWIPIAFIAAGVGTVAGFAGGNGWLQYVGPCVMLISGAVGVGHFLPPRLVFTLAGAGVIAYSFLADQLEEIEQLLDEGPGLFFVSGIFMLLAGMMIIAFNLSVVLWVMGLASSRLKRLEPIVRIAIAYPAVSRMRTALTMGMFGLVLFGVTLITMYTGLLDGFIDANLEKAGGGFDAIVYNSSTNRIVDLESELVASGAVDMSQIVTIAPVLRAQVKFPDFEVRRPEIDQEQSDAEPASERYVADSIHGIGPEFAAEQRYSLDTRSPEYATDADAWAAVAADPTLALVSARYDGSTDFIGNALLEPGDKVRLFNPATEEIVEKTVIGRLEPIEFGFSVLWGVVVSAEALQEEFAESSYRGDAPRLFALRLSEGTDLASFEKQMEKALITTGAPVRVIREVLANELRETSALMRILQAFLAFGLIVGVAGLAVIAARSVHQRRQGIGILRALGFQPGMVLASLLIEWSFIALVGIMLGVSLGFLGGYRLYALFVQEAGGEFTVPWLELLGIIVLVYAASLTFTIFPARRASMMAPVEALRYQD
jgi:putative ABC transport system permease protein